MSAMFTFILLSITGVKYLYLDVQSCYMLNPKDAQLFILFIHCQCVKVKLLTSFQIKVLTRDASQVQQPEEEGGRGCRQAAQEDQAAGERGQVRLPEEG